MADTGNVFTVTGENGALICLLCGRRLDCPPQGNIYNSGLAIEYAAPVMGRPKKANVTHYLCSTNPQGFVPNAEEASR